MVSAILKLVVDSGKSGNCMEISGGRQIALAVIALGILLGGFYLLNVTPLSVAYSIGCAAALYAISYIWPRVFSRKSEQPGPGQYMRDVMISALRISLFAMAIIFLIKVRPDLGSMAVELVWPLLGPAIYIFALSVQSILRARLRA